VSTPLLTPRLHLTATWAAKCNRAGALALGGCAALVAVSLALRTTAIGEGLWIDEGLSAGIAGHPLGELPGLLRQDGSPLLFYVLLHGWMQVFGDGEEALRSLSLLAALATIPAALWAGWSLFGARAGAAAALLAATNPFVTAYAQEARMYALVALLSLLTAATFLHAFAVRRRAFAFPFGVVLALLLHTHNWGLFLAAGSLAALGLLAAGQPDRRSLAKDAALAYGIAALQYAPWIPTLVFQAAHTGAPWSNTPGPGKLADALLVPLGGGIAGATALAVATLSAARFGLRRAGGEKVAARPWAGRDGAWGVQDLRGDDARALGALLIMAVIAAVLAWLASQLEPNWANRYFAVVVGPLLLAAAAGAARLRAPGLIATGAIALVWATDTGRMQHGNARELAAAVAPDARTLVISAQPEQLAVLHHYMGAAPAYATTLGPATDPAVMDWRDATARLRAARPVPTLARTLAAIQIPARVVVVRPVIASPRHWRAPWTRLVRARTKQWTAALDAHPRLRRTRTTTPPASGGADVGALEWRVRAP
jgi:mannosyltransferase